MPNVVFLYKDNRKNCVMKSGKRYSLSSVEPNRVFSL